MFIEIISYGTGVISSNLIENKVITHITSAVPAYQFVYDFLHFRWFPTTIVKFVLYETFFLRRSWFECSCLSVEDIYFYRCYFLFSTILFLHCFSSQNDFLINLWPIDSYFSFVLFQPKAGVCRLQNVNSYKMRWKFDPYCCSEIWLSCFPVPFCSFQTVFCCWRQTYCDV